MTDASPIVWEVFERNEGGEYLPLGRLMVLSSKHKIDAINPWGGFEVTLTLMLPTFEMVPTGAVVTGFIPGSTEKRTWLLVSPGTLSREEEV